jgi:hypothetical protein
MSGILKRLTLVLGLTLTFGAIADSGVSADTRMSRAQRLEAVFLAAGGKTLLEERLAALQAQEEARATTLRDRSLARLKPDGEQSARFAEATAEHLARLGVQLKPGLQLNAGQLQDADPITDQDIDALLAFYRSASYQRAARWLSTTAPGVTGWFDQQFERQAEESRRTYARRLRELTSECNCPR